MPIADITKHARIYVPDIPQRKTPAYCRRLTLNSLDKGVRKNADGTVDIYFGPKPSAGQEANWLYTQRGQKWFPWFRVYGPEKAIFDKSWKLPDIEMVS